MVVYSSLKKGDVIKHGKQNYVYTGSRLKPTTQSVNKQPKSSNKSKGSITSTLYKIDGKKVTKEEYEAYTQKLEQENRSYKEEYRVPSTNTVIETNYNPKNKEKTSIMYKEMPAIKTSSIPSTTSKSGTLYHQQQNTKTITQKNYMNTLYSSPTNPTKSAYTIQKEKEQQKALEFERKLSKINEKYYKDVEAPPIIEAGKEGNISVQPKTQKVFKGNEKKYQQEVMKAYQEVYPSIKEFKINFQDLKPFEITSKTIKESYKYNTNLNPTPIKEFINTKITRENIDAASKALEKTNIVFQETQQQQLGKTTLPRNIAGMEQTPAGLKEIKGVRSNIQDFYSTEMKKASATFIVSAGIGYAAPAVTSSLISKGLLTAKNLATIKVISYGTGIAGVSYKGYRTYKSIEEGKPIKASLEIGDVAVTAAGLYTGYKAFKSDAFQSIITKNLREPLFNAKLKSLDKNSLYSKSFNKDYNYQAYKFENAKGKVIPQQRTLTTGMPISKDKISFLRSDIGMQTIKQPSINVPGYEGFTQKTLFPTKTYGVSGKGVFMYNAPYSQVGGIPIYTSSPRIIPVNVARYLSGQELSFKIISKQTSLEAFGFTPPSTTGRPVNIIYPNQASVPNYAGGFKSTQSLPAFTSGSEVKTISVSGSEFQDLFSKTVGKVLGSKTSIPPSEPITTYTPPARIIPKVFITPIHINSEEYQTIKEPSISITEKTIINNNVESLNIPRNKIKYRQLEVTKSKVFIENFNITKSNNLLNIKQRASPSSQTRSLSSTNTITDQIPQTLLDQKQLLKQKQSFTNQKSFPSPVTPSKYYQIPPTPATPAFFPLPDLKIRKKRRTQKGFRGLNIIKTPKSYKPTLYTNTFNIFGKETKILTQSGIGIRPIKKSKTKKYDLPRMNIGGFKL